MEEAIQLLGISGWGGSASSEGPMLTVKEKQHRRNQVNQCGLLMPCKTLLA